MSGGGQLPDIVSRERLSDGVQAHRASKVVLGSLSDPIQLRDFALPTDQSAEVRTAHAKPIALATLGRPRAVLRGMSVEYGDNISPATGRERPRGCGHVACAKRLSAWAFQ